MKTIFISIYDGDTEKNILRTDVWKVLLKSGNHFVLLIRGSDRLDYYKKEFASPQVSVELLPSARSAFEDIWYYIGWNSIPTRAISVRRYRQYWSRQRYLHGSVGAMLWVLGHLRVWRNFLRFIYRYTASEYVPNLFDKYRPDLLFAPSMFSAEDCRLMVMANKLGIPTVSTVKSWDVLPTKAFTRVRSNVLLVFNEFNKQEAVAFGDYRPEQITITGFPQFDIYTDGSVQMSRKEFCERIGLDPEKRFIMYGVPGDWKSPFSKEILQELGSRQANGKFKKPLQVLARLHPKYSDSSEGMQIPNVVFYRPGKYFKSIGEFGIDSGMGDVRTWTFGDDDIKYLANSLQHADVLVCTDSTLTLDAAANDKPTILIAYDGNQSLPYKKSIAFIYEREHYARLLATGGVLLAHNHDELVQHINDFLVNPVHLAVQRNVLRQKLLYKCDGKSGERVARAVLDVLS